MTAQLEAEILAAVDGASDAAALEAVRVSALGKSGSISDLLKSLGGMSPDERRERGPQINGLRDRVQTAIAARKWMDIDELGLDELDRSVLRAIIEMYGGGPVGLETLAAALGEESVTLEDICEPYLMQMGMLTRTPRGRCVTRLAYEHLHMAVPKRFDDEDSGQTSMF